jgi:hypothetical protein
MMTDAEKKAATEVILGVDTHLDVHVAVALDHLGRRLGELSVPTTAKGYEKLVLRHPEVCRGRGNQHLRGCDHPLPEDR